MKKIVSMLLGLALCLSLSTPAAQAMGLWDGHTSPMLGPGGTYLSKSWSTVNRAFNNFHKTQVYDAGTFSDVPAGAWYEEGVQTLYERGLTEAGGRFSPQGGVTLGEVVSMAVLLHRTYNGWSMPEGMSGLQYALNTGIVIAGQYDDYTAPATRRSFAAIMANALPQEALEGVNIIMDDSIPDVPMSDPGAQGIYRLYRAGVLVGGDARGTFRPDGPVTRAAAAVIAARMVDPSLRQGITLMKDESHSVSLSRAALSLSPGESARLTADVFPVNAQDRSVDWASSETRTVTVDQDGLVTAIQPGTAYVIATTPAGATATCSVRVVDRS